MERRSRESGMVFVLSIIIVFFISAIGLSLLQSVSAQYGSYKKRLYAENAVAAAEAGVSTAIYQLNKDSSFVGYGTSEQQIYATSAQGRAAYTITVSTDASLNKVILSTGRAYTTTDASNLASTKQIRAVVTLKKDKITNSLIIGSGGLYLAAGSVLTKSDVYVRGQLKMETGASIASSTEPATINIANIGCGTTGASSNWPQPCGPSDQPIKMLTLPSANIYGSVCATDQVTMTGITPTPPAGCVSDISANPYFNKKAFVQSVSASGSDPALYTCGNVFGAVTKTIPAGTRINGSLTIANPFGSCTVVVEGDVYITGALLIGANGTLKPSDSVGTNRPTIVSNTGLGLSGTALKILRNNVGTPLFLITFYSINNACSLSETIPSDTVQTCLTNDEARLSADSTPGSTANGGGAVIDLTGAIFYGYYTSFRIASTNITFAFYGIGAQGAWIAANSRMSSVADDAAFGNVLFIPNYRLVDYRQL